MTNNKICHNRDMTSRIIIYMAILTVLNVHIDLTLVRFLLGNILLQNPDNNHDLWSASA